MPTLDQDLAAQVRGLLDREAIRACLNRYCRGVDRFDRELLLSAFHPDCLDEHGKFAGLPDEFADWALTDEIPDMADLSSFTSTRALLTLAERAFMNGGRAPARDRSDPSYDRPLVADPARREGYLALRQDMQTGAEPERGA